MSVQSEQLNSFVRMHTGMVEHRKYIRIQWRIKGKLTLENNRNTTTVFATRDMSPVGMLIAVPEAIESGSVWLIELNEDKWKFSGIKMKILEYRGRTSEKRRWIYSVCFIDQPPKKELELARDLYGMSH